MSRILSSDVIASLVTKMIKCRVILSSSLMEQSGWWSVQPDRSQRLHLSNDIEIDLLFRRDTSQRFHRFHRHPPPLDSQKTAQHHRLGHHRFILDVLRSGHHRIHLLGLVSGRFRLPGVYVVVVGVPHGLLLLNMLLALTDRFVAINYPLLHREKQREDDGSFRGRNHLFEFSSTRFSPQIDLHVQINSSALWGVSIPRQNQLVGLHSVRFVHVLNFTVYRLTKT